MTDLRVKYSLKNTKKADFLHSSGYAKAQNGNKIGASDQASFEARQAIENHRKYVRKYHNSKLLQGVRGFEKAKTYVPRVEKTADVARGRGTLTPDQPSKNSPATPSTTSTHPQLPTRPTISTPPPRRTPSIKL